MKDVMLDFETLGNGDNKVLCQVGAIYFDKVTGELGQEFKLNIDAASHVKFGGKIDAETVYWWLSQSDVARQSILSDPKVSIVEAMIKLNEFLHSANRVWSHATFDFVTLMQTFKQLNIKPSISYKAGMDIRTLVYLSGISTNETLRTGVHHDALEDAKHQVKYCVKALNLVKNNKKLLNFVSLLGE
jgi:hypothetical protein